jgi:hypothetical protein
LVGSHARGTAHAESDIDLVIITSVPSTFLTTETKVRARQSNGKQHVRVGMTPRMIVGIVALVCGSVSALLATFTNFEIIDKVNEKLPDSEKFDLLGWVSTQDAKSPDQVQDVLSRWAASNKGPHHYSSYVCVLFHRGVGFRIVCKIVV